MRVVEDETKNHSLTSSSSSGRITPAYTHKKKRLDEEFERLLYNIDQKRDIITKLDYKSTEICRCIDIRETEMVDCERELVQILMEQQRNVLKLLNESKLIDTQCIDILIGARIPFPSPLGEEDIVVSNLFSVGGPFYVEKSIEK